MEPLFINKSLYTKQNLIESNKATMSRKSLIIFILCIELFAIIVGIITSDYLLILGGILFCVFYLLLSLWAVRHSAVNRYQQLLQLYHGEAESITNFYEDHLDIHYLQGGSDVTIAYTQIAKVFETKTLFFLMLSTRIGFLMEKLGFEGITPDEFGRFIRARAVGEGRKDLKKRTRKSILIVACVFIAFLILGLAIGFFGDIFGNLIPKKFQYDNYSIKLTSAFEEDDGEWISTNASVYCFYESNEALSSYGSVYKTAEAYLQNTNESYDIDSAVTPISNTIAWTKYNLNYDGTDYFYYDYVIKTDTGFWYTEFYCLAEDTGKYLPLFEKWAETIVIDSEMS